MNMDKKVYMIMPDTTPPFNLVTFHTYINNLYVSKYIQSWWHYLPGGLYFVATHLSANELYNLLIKFPQKNIIIMEVNPKNQQGWLVKKAWDWFKSYRES